jgi:hypothetical protein
MSFFFIYKIREQEGGTRSCLGVGVGASGSREEVGKGHGRVNTVHICAQMCVNGKMRPVETVPGMGRGEKKENGRRIEFKYDTLIYCNNFCICHNVPPTQHN